MAFRIQNNIAAMNAQRNLGISDAGMSKSLERLSSGYRINSAKDDAAGLAISQGFRADIASVKVAQRNISEANALLQTAEGAMSSVGDILTRMKELATQAASANVGTDIGKLSTEYNSLVSEIDRIADSTKYAGSALVDGSFTASANTSASWSGVDNIYDVSVSNAATGSYTVSYSATSNALTVTDGTKTQSRTLENLTAQTVDFTDFGISFKTTVKFVADTAGAAMDAANQTVTAGTGAKNFQVGYENNDQSKLSISLGDLNTVALKTGEGDGLATDDISTSAKALTAMDNIDDSIDKLNSLRGDVGAYQNRLGYAGSNLATTLENFTAADSVIRDVDMAAEMTNFTKNQILVQAGTSMLAQANMSSQGVLSLFQ